MAAKQYHDFTFQSLMIPFRVGPIVGVGRRRCDRHVIAGRRRLPAGRRARSIGWLACDRRPSGEAALPEAHLGELARPLATRNDTPSLAIDSWLLVRSLAVTVMRFRPSRAAA